VNGVGIALISSTSVESAAHLYRELLTGVDSHRRRVCVFTKKRYSVRFALMSRSLFVTDT